MRSRSDGQVEIGEQVGPAAATGSSRCRAGRWRTLRPAWLAGVLFLGLALSLAALAWPSDRDTAAARVVVRWLSLTDLCLTTESPASRHPALADPALPLQFVPGAPDAWPALPFFDPPVPRPMPRSGRIIPAPRAGSSGP